MHRRIKCAEIWGGIAPVNQDIATSSLAIGIYSAPCEGESGGDIYYVSVCGGDQLTRIAIADLQGHGEQVSAMSRRIYESLLDHLGDLDNRVVLAELNRFALTQGYGAMTTAVVVSFLLSDGTMSYSYAGHPPVLLRLHNDAQWTALHPPAAKPLANAALGVFEEVEYEQWTLPLAPGDRFCVYTDGIIECTNPHNEPWGAKRFVEALARQNQHPIADAKTRILAEFESYAAGPADDDATLLMVEVQSAA